MYGTPVDDLESGSSKNWVSDQRLRSGFVRKVLGLVLAQLVVFVAIVSAFVYSETVKLWATSSSGSLVTLVCFLSVMVITVLPLCYPSAYREYPKNYIILLVYTLALAVTIAGEAAKLAQSGPHIFLQSLAVTALVVAALVVFAAFSDVDMTTMLPYVATLSMALIIGLVIGIVVRSNLLNTVVSMLSAVSFGLYLMIDLQLIMGRGSLKLSEDEYVLAAIMVYTDVAYIFLDIMRLSKSDD
ncbi:MAG: uncharacterized protein KVP18_002376 [Porospora cf. gigantea A]|uniref:uncharacterized protein n=1 Tax=Porospora cf. gigantea A TaxID=2853593 RepID=UPI003559D7AD|nr:MAG: hypothetical protein KVP18_002376 [Porospora cf. gigantea A]